MIWLALVSQITPDWTFVGERSVSYRNVAEEIDLGQRDRFAFRVVREGASLRLLLTQTFLDSRVGPHRVPPNDEGRPVVSRHVVFPDGTWNLAMPADLDELDQRFLCVLNALSKRPPGGGAEHAVAFTVTPSQGDVLLRDLGVARPGVRRVKVTYREKGILWSGEAAVREAPRWVETLSLSMKDAPIPGGPFRAELTITYREVPRAGSQPSAVR